MKEELIDEGILDHLSHQRINELLRRADMDGNQMITYPEFVHMVSFDFCRKHIDCVMPITNSYRLHHRYKVILCIYIYVLVQ